MAKEITKSTVNDQIRENLQRVYDEALQEDVPKEFVEMVKRLKAKKDAETDGK